MIAQLHHADTADSTYRSLHKAGGIGALIVAVLTLSEVVIFALYPQPATVSGWFTLFQSSKLLGLLDFWLLEVPMYIMFILAFLAFYFVLRNANRGLMGIAVVVALLGIAIFLATNNPFSMLSLSNQYAVATTDMERAAFLAAGQTLLANTGQRAVDGFNTGLFLVSVAGLIVSTVMLQSSSFSRSTAVVGVAANTLSLLDYVRQALTSSDIVALLVILPNALCLIAWYILVGRRLYQLGRRESR